MALSESLASNAPSTGELSYNGEVGRKRNQSQRYIDKYLFVRRSLIRYKELYNDMMVPRRFVVPGQDDQWPEEMWAMKLGDVVNNIRRGISYIDKRDDLSSIGFYFGVAQARYEAIKVALVHYAKENGTMMVPRRFTVPNASKEWPRETLGIRLGEIVYNIKRGASYVDKREDLIKIGFYFESRHDYESGLVLRALLKFKELNGNSIVPLSFVVPENTDEWPEELWGMHLGSVVVRVKSGGYADRKEEFVSKGIVLDQADLKFNIAMQALVNFKNLNGHMLVPTRFVVPSETIDWPVETWGLKLGSIVTKIRNGHYANRHQELLRIGFSFNASAAKFNIAKTALLLYKNQYGCLRVPQKFVVPSDSIEWPHETRGMKLGTLVDSIRQGLSYADRREELIALGFDYKHQSKRAFTFSSVCTALKTFRGKEGHMLVPRSFSVPSTIEWPEETWGMKLGILVNSIRNGKSYADRRNLLLDIGFVYVAKNSTSVM